MLDRAKGVSHLPAADHVTSIFVLEMHKWVADTPLVLSSLDTASAAPMGEPLREKPSVSHSLSESELLSIVSKGAEEMPSASSEFMRWVIAMRLRMHPTLYIACFRGIRLNAGFYETLFDAFTSNGVCDEEKFMIIKRVMESNSLYGQSMQEGMCYLN
jgi:hypothetical protein